MWYLLFYFLDTYIGYGLELYPYILIEISEFNSSNLGISFIFKGKFKPCIFIVLKYY